MIRPGLIVDQEIIYLHLLPGHRPLLSRTAKTFPNHDPNVANQSKIIETFPNHRIYPSQIIETVPWQETIYVETTTYVVAYPAEQHQTETSRNKRCQPGTTPPWSSSSENTTNAKDVLFDVLIVPSSGRDPQTEVPPSSVSPDEQPSLLRPHSRGRSSY